MINRVYMISVMNYFPILIYKISLNDFFFFKLKHQKVELNLIV